MTAALLAITITLLAGAPLARALDRQAPLLRWIGESYLVGTGLVTLTMLALSIAGLRWSLVNVLTVMAIVWSAGVLAGWSAGRRAGGGTAGQRPALLIDLATLVALAGYARYATAAPPWELDFIDNWGLKAQVFWNVRGIDWSFLSNDWYWWSHPDYPPLLPLNFDFVALFSGGFADRWLGTLSVAMAIAALLIIRSLLAEELHSAAAAAFATFILAFLLATPWVGTADGPLTALITSGVLLIRHRFFTAGSVLLGIGALCKNEGLSFIVAVAIAMLADRTLRGSIAKLWPAVMIPLPWLALRVVHRLPTDLASGSILSRTFEHLQHPALYLHLLTTNTFGRPLLWLGILMTMVITLRKWIENERLIVLTVALQLVFYVAAYIVTPLDVAFHVRWSWDRLVWHVVPLLAYAALVSVLPEATSWGRVSVNQQNGSTV